MFNFKKSINLTHYLIATLFNTLQFVIIGSGNVTPQCPHQMFPRKMFSNEMYTTEALTNETYINEMSTRKIFSPPKKVGRQSRVTVPLM